MGGGGAWSKDHDKILDHARDLHYDHVPGINLPDADASRETWTTSMDAFNDWKAREVAKEAEGQAWWQTYKGGEGGGENTAPDKKPGGPDWDNPDPGTGTGPYPDSNMYFPMLVPEYNDPQAQDWSEYMPDGQSGLLYQPWSQEYGEQFMQPNIWNYQPPELKVGRPQYLQNPLGIMDVTDYVPSSESKDEEYDRANDPDGQYDGTGGDSYGAGSHGGMMPGDRGYLGYMASLNAEQNMADLLGLLGLGGTTPGVDTTTGNESEYGAGTYGSGTDMGDESEFGSGTYGNDGDPALG